MTGILTITLNPALDTATETARVVPELKLRCSEPRVDPGGGGINVARAIRHLGGQATALVATAGYNGQKLLYFLALEGIPTVAVPGPGETRSSVAVTDKETGEQYRFVLPGPPWDANHVDMALGVAQGNASPGGFVVLSGSQPPGVPVDFEEQLTERLRHIGARLIVDTSGAPLRHLVENPKTPPFLLRSDDDEAEGLAGRKLATPADTAAYSRELIARGVAENVIFARGAEGSVLTTPEGSWLATAAKVKVVSKVGAGDSYVGGFTWALARGETIQEAARVGAAAASAAVTTEATQLCTKEDVERLLPECKLIPV